MCKRKNKDKKDKFLDDGMTVANMNVQGLPWYTTEEQKKEKKAIRDLRVTRRERRAMIAAAFATYLPVLLVIIGTFGGLYLLLYFFVFK